jgi:hypothetical protein
MLRVQGHSFSNLSWGEEAEADLVVGRGREEVAKDVEKALSMCGIELSWKTVGVESDELVRAS